MGLLTPDCSFLGKQYSGRIGYYLSEAGDVNADGYDDFMIAAYHVSLHGWNSGAVFLFLGGENKWGLNASVNEADAIFRGKKAFDMMGYHVEGGGDFNGDGFDDLLIGAPGNWERKPGFPGKAYIVFGGKNPQWSSDFILEDHADVAFVGEKNFDQFGYAVAFAGDLNNDGCDDILCGAAFRTELNEWSGKVYLIFGRRSVDQREMAAVDVSAATFIYDSVKGKLGSSVAGVGDVNQDGFPDFMMGAPGIGTSFLLFGNAEQNWGQNFDLSQADCIFTPEFVLDDAGWQIKPAGDVNNDGFPDILISGLEIEYEKGKVYVIFGKKDWNQSVFPLSDADASYIGEGGRNQAGVSINGIHDFNGDGFDDFLIGARWYGNTYKKIDLGKAYLIYGKPSGWSRDVDLREIDTYFIGEDTVNCAGWGVSYAGDVNGDFRDDFIISAPFNSQIGNYTGKVYLFKGNHTLNRISGRIHYHSNNMNIQNVRLKLNNAENMVVTGLDGYYLFHQPGENQFYIKPYKEANTDIGGRSISIYDAALTAFREHELNEFQRMAADVNIDGAVNFDDAQLIAEYVINVNSDQESHVGEWVFVPEMRQYLRNQLPKTDEDYAGVLLGEVSGNWKPTAEAKALRKTVNFTPEYIHQNVVEIPFLWDSNKSLSVAEIVICYDPDLLQFSHVKKNENMQNYSLFHNVEEPGLLKIALMGENNIEANYNFLNVYFTANESMSKIQASIDQFDFEEYMSYDCEITAADDYQNQVYNFQLTNNYPNPFNASTTIEYYLSKPSEVTLKIFNVYGREIKTLYTGTQQSGAHRCVWDGTDNADNNVSSGLYLFHIECAGELQTKKLILLK